jgi:putative colanic acid biosynthesis acetyltransferase WcaF
MTRIRNDKFCRDQGFKLGRPRWVFALWYLVKTVFFLSALPWPSALKSRLLRLFGAKVGTHVCWKPRVNVHFPWKLSVGDHTWIGEEVCIINFEPVSIGSHCCVSQRALLCAGSHDYRSFEMAYRNASIEIGDGVWIGANCFVCPGIRIGSEAVATATSTVTRDLPAGYVCSGNPCAPVRRRWTEDHSTPTLAD